MTISRIVRAITKVIACDFSIFSMCVIRYVGAGMSRISRIVGEDSNRGLDHMFPPGLGKDIHMQKAKQVTDLERSGLSPSQRLQGG